MTGSELIVIEGPVHMIQSAPTLAAEQMSKSGGVKVFKVSVMTDDGVKVVLPGQVGARWA